jgi:hypothetical protein
MPPVAFFLLGFGAWLTALAVPPCLALWFWNKAPSRIGKWPAHLLFAPLLLLLEWLLVQVLFFAAHDDGEGPPGLGFALIPQAFLLLGTLAAYYVGAIVQAAGNLWRQLNDR